MLTKPAFVLDRPEVLATSEMRLQLPRIAERCRTEGLGAGIVYFGAYRHADAASHRIAAGSKIGWG